MRMRLLFHKSSALIFLMLVSVITSAQTKFTDNLALTINPVNNAFVFLHDFFTLKFKRRRELSGIY